MLAKFSSFFRRTGRQRSTRERVAQTSSSSVPSADCANVAHAGNGQAASASGSQSQSDANLHASPPEDAFAVGNNQKSSAGLDPMDPVKRATSDRRFHRFFLELAKRKEDEVSRQKVHLLLTFGLFEKSEAVWPFCYNCNKRLKTTIESFAEHLREDHPTIWRDLEGHWIEKEDAMREWQGADGPLDVVDHLFGLFYKAKREDTWCKECNHPLKLGRCKTPKSLRESLEAHLKLHADFERKYRKECALLTQKENAVSGQNAEWRARLLVKFFLEQHSQNKDLQDEIELAERRVWLKQDGLFFVAEEFGADKGSLMLPHWNRELLIPHKQICTSLHFITPKLDPVEDPRVRSGRYALETLKDVAEGSWKKHGVGDGSSLANLASKAIFMAMAAEHSDAYVRQGDDLRVFCTTHVPEPDFKRRAVPEDVVARRVEAKSLINRLSGVLSIAEAIQALEGEAVLIVNFGRHCDDPFQKSLAESAIPINSPLKARLLRTICGSGSLLRHGVVIIEMLDDGTCSIKCVTTRPIIGAQRESALEKILTLNENGETKLTYMTSRESMQRDRVAFWMSKFLRSSALVLQAYRRSGNSEFRISAQGILLTVDGSFFANAQKAEASNRTSFPRLRFRKTKAVSEVEVNNVLSHLRATIQALQKSSNGALIVLATSKSGYLNRLGTLTNKPEAMEAAVSAQLLLAILNKSSELHDGAVVIELFGDALGSAASIRWAGLLSDKTQGKKVDSIVSQNAGSRHRAADYLHMKTGFPVVVVSETDGQLSVACRGKRKPMNVEGACTVLLEDLKRQLRLV